MTRGNAAVLTEQDRSAILKKRDERMSILRKAAAGFCCLMIALGLSGLAVLGISWLAG